MSTPALTHATQRTDIAVAFSDFGVKRQYKPRTGSGLMARTITVLERQQPVEQIPQMVGALTPVWEVEALNDALTGVTRAQLDTGGDTIEVMHQGVLEFREIARILHEDEVTLRLEVR